MRCISVSNTRVCPSSCPSSLHTRFNIRHRVSRGYVVLPWSEPTLANILQLPFHRLNNRRLLMARALRSCGDYSALEILLTESHVPSTTPPIGRRGSCSSDASENLDTGRRNGLHLVLFDACRSKSRSCLVNSHSYV
ncbi:d2.4 [Ichnoviriform fugitivi]|uniref:D2.4 n=1 Tax=Ichnoviriform fugitivi TaxID=265522 RepID=A2Q0J8_9VIRU|nr:d2.4 [Ichnoviriform fugitivi]BAF45713.1 d2.4 [Ichnoviriform fugitivi]